MVLPKGAFLLSQLACVTAVSQGHGREAMVVTSSGSIEREAAVVRTHKFPPKEPALDLGSSMMKNGRDTGALLAQVKGTIRNTADPSSRESIRAIKELVDGTLLPAVLGDHKELQDGIDAAILAIEKSNSEAVERQNHIEQHSKASVVAARVDHSNCRKGCDGCPLSQADLRGAKDEACGKLGGYIASIREPPIKPVGKDAMISYVREMSEYWCGKGQHIESLDKNCTEAEDEYSEKTKVCKQKQSTFEFNFCDWRTRLTDECDRSQAEYNSKVRDYEHKKASGKTLANTYTAEYKALEMILCYANLWLKDDNHSTVDLKQYQHCEELEPESPMNLSYGTLPPKAVCDVQQVESHPGTSGFENIEYSDFAEVEATNPCPEVEPQVVEDCSCLKPLESAACDKDFVKMFEDAHASGSRCIEYQYNWETTPTPPTWCYVSKECTSAQHGGEGKCNYREDVTDEECVFKESSLPSCEGHPEQFDAGYGNCEAYAAEKENHRYCNSDADKVSGKLAEVVCPGCLKCA